jgi:hypothetical protein
MLIGHNTFINAIQLIISVLFLGVAFFALQAFNRFIVITAQHDCATDYRFTAPDTINANATVSFPITGLYEQCLQEKGVGVLPALIE